MRINTKEKRLSTIAPSLVDIEKHILPNLPSELLILNRYGIGYPYLKAAWKLSYKFNMPAFQILINAKVISLEIWLDAQLQLKNERQRLQDKLTREAFLLEQSVNNLSDTLPQYSAKQTFRPWQTVALCLCCITLIAVTFFQHETAIPAFLLFFTLFYSAVILLRGLLLAHFEPSKSISTSLIVSNDDTLPIYSVLVALYKEHNQVEQLIQHLWALDWPREKLDIKLICEADDYKTIAAIKDAKLPSCFELICVPFALPRTKPKALNYALPSCQGEYLVLYDAEDMPSSRQLREAYAKFQTSDEKLACLQAPLHIHNHEQNWLSGMFALEYVTLFSGILPVLAKWGVPIPLGGTSNHFKVDILKRVGAWDPYNVTEDADLGIRLYREGYKCSTITLPTYEEAPPHFLPWLKQRTRWLKGWMQTILVHNRNPLHFFTDLGLKNTIAFHLLLTSIIISMLIHPFFVFATLWQILSLNASFISGLDSFLIIVSIFNLVGGYTTYGLLAYAVIQKSNYKPYAILIFTLPLYWLLISFAGWRALVHLIVKPHHWEKTPHGLAN